MRWRVVKMGSVCFDALHAYGVAIVLATLTRQPVTIQDAGRAYELTSPVQALPETTSDLFDVLFPLPTAEQFALSEKKPSAGLPLTILDGLLAVLFTNPIAPAKANVHDLSLAQQFQPLTVVQGLHKVTKKIQDWKEWVQHTAQDATNWAAEMLGDYTWHTPVAPVLFAGQSKHDLHVLMTIDPSFAYSFHQAINTGKMTQKTNVAIHGTRYAALLAFVGAARFLRSRSVADPYLIFSVPVVESGMIESWTSLPLLEPEEQVPPDLALTRQWLAQFTVPVLPALHWRSLAYQILQKQKRQQPLCCESGQLVFSWLRQVEQQAGTDVLAFWQRCLQYGSLEEQEPLVGALKRQRPESWYHHLTQRTSVLLTAPASTLRPYRFEEVRKVTAMIDPSSSHPLRAVLERKHEGTVRFGHALRLLGRTRPDIRCDLIEQLEPVRTEEAFLRVLHHLVNECANAKLKERYILVPTDDDFPPLLDDIHQHGLRQIVGVLLVLSTLHYSPSEDLRKYGIGTLIRALLALITYSSSLDNNQEPPEESSFLVEQLMADEHLLLFSQEENDASE